MYAEAIGVKQVLSWIAEQDIQGVIVETDCKMVVDALNSDDCDLSEFGCIFRASKQLLLSGNRVSIRFMKRLVNEVANTIARAACCHTSPYVWWEAPDFIASKLAYVVSGSV
ncbi:hypothetical protein DITRI_Ditri07aG0073500 [Diplodiscus trichospermus]